MPSELPTVVTLTVADPGDALSLADVSSVDYDNCSTDDEVSVNGQTVGDSVTCSTDPDDESFVEYSLARNAAALEATVGTDDRG